MYMSQNAREFPENENILPSTKQGKMILTIGAVLQTTSDRYIRPLQLR